MPSMNAVRAGSLGAVVLLCAVLPSGLRGQEPATVVLRVGMDTRSPPWSFVPGQDYSGEDPDRDPAITQAQLKGVIGLDVDVAADLARRLGVSLRIEPVAWSGLRQALVARRIDAIVNAFTPTPNEPDLTVTDPYFSWGLLVAVRSGDGRVRGFQDLAGLTVGHFQTNILHRTLRSLKPSQLRAYDVQEALFDDLKAGKLDAVIYDSPYVRWRAANDPAFQVVGEPLNRLGYHVAVRRDDTALFRRLQAAVAAFAASPEAESIRRKWEQPGGSPPR